MNVYLFSLVKRGNHEIRRGHKEITKGRRNAEEMSQRKIEFQPSHLQVLLEDRHARRILAIQSDLVDLNHINHIENTIRKERGLSRVFHSNDRHSFLPGGPGGPGFPGSP